MSRVVVRSIGVSLDGYAAGPDQALAHPLGVGGEQLFDWAFKTRVFKTMFGEPGGDEGVDNDFALRGFDNIGAWILGRNMFGPVRGPWPDDSWRGWWGEEPPYHTQCFVLTHHSRAPLVMDGGTTFHFVTDGIEAALDQARAAAKGQDVRIGGGAETISQYLSARLVDELHIAMAPVVLGKGEPLFAGLNLASLGYQVSERVCTDAAVHWVMTKQAG